MDRNPLITNILSRQTFLAPMLGITDIPFRTICREFGAGMVSTEMVSTTGILAGESESFRNATFDPQERPIAMQLVANSPEAARIVIPELLRFHPTVFDINSGCPNDRICEAGAGAALLDNPELLSAIVRAVVECSPTPVSVKLRTYGHKHIPITDVVKTLEAAGAAYITVHGRGRHTSYAEPSVWDSITEAKAAVSIPVIGNGDVFSAREAFSLKESTGCDAIMIGRGALGTPWIFRDIALGRRCGILDYAPSMDELRTIVQRHCSMLFGEFGPVLALPRVRKHIMWYTRHLEQQDTLRRNIFSSDTATEIAAGIDEFFDREPVRIDPDSMEYREIETRFRNRVLFWTLPTELHILG